MRPFVKDCEYVSRRSSRMRASWCALGTMAACAAACNLLVDTSAYQFLEAAGAGGAAPTGGGAAGTNASGTDSGAGATGAGGSACVPDCNGKECGPDGCGGLCGDCGEGECDTNGTCCAATWSVSLPNEGSRIELATDGSSLYVGDRNGGVRRLRTCDGTAVEGSKVASLTPNFWVRSLLNVDATLYAAGFGPGGVGVYPLDPSTLEVLPEGLLTLPGASYPGDPIRDGTKGPGGTLLFGASLDGGGFIRFQPGKTSCRYDASTVGVARGITSTSTAIVMGVMVISGNSPVTNFLSVPFDQLDPASCTASLAPTTLGSIGGITLGMAGGKLRSFATLVRGDLATDTTSVLARIDPDGTVVETTSNASAKVDGFGAVATDGTQVFVGGSTNATYTGALDAVVSGEARVARYPFEFPVDAMPTADATLPGATAVWGIAQDAHGVYVVGLASGNTGFVAKCSRALDCPVLPAN